ncbi:MAG: hypothetical protein KOO60_13480 [Gemmatimonadales bacterium]|nr:hypothetical protein [Gemmatimonadales bacterium]
MMPSLLITLLVALVLMLISAPAFAYIDPGTGSFLIQGIIAAVIGVSVAFKLFWHKIKAVFTGKPLKEDDDDDE